MQRLKGFLGFLWDSGKVLIISLAIIVPIRAYIFQPFFVRGASMEPNFSNGEYLIIDELSYRLRDPLRNEVIVFRFPNDPSQYYIKRIIGLPGETVEVRGGGVYIKEGNDEPVLLDESFLPEETKTSGEVSLTLGPGEYFALGDNRSFSSDSRRWGGLRRELIIGRVALVAWPLDHFSVLAAPTQ